MDGDGPQALIGRVVDGRYRVTRSLGAGAVGSVYCAVDAGQGDREFALKVWHVSADDEQTRGRFLREAKAMETLDHPNMVGIHGHGFVDGRPFMVMELLQGQTLEERLEADALEPALALELARQLLDGLAHAHSHNVVHRDLKPDNVFLVGPYAETPRVKILDYGLAKFIERDDDPTAGVALTMQGMLMGSPLYMPPEQAAGGNIDLHTDVYALGCVLFEMLTGRLPFVADTHLELTRLHLLEPVPQLGDAREGLEVAAELQALIETAMAKRAVERFPDAGRMRAAFEALPQPAATLRGAEPEGATPGLLGRIVAFLKGA